MWIQEKKESPKSKEVALKHEIKEAETENYDYMKSDFKHKTPYFGQKTTKQKRQKNPYNLSTNEDSMAGSIYPKNKQDNKDVKQRVEDLKL